VAAYGGLERLIRRMVEEHMPTVLALLGDEKNPRGRLIAAKALGFSPDPRAIQALVGLLSQDDPSLLENALMGLALQARATMPADAIAFHLESFDPRVQRNAALALYRVVR
jgi:HEAT repeat protein